MLKKQYSCNICLAVKKPEDLYGCNFVSMSKFILTFARVTDGQHICKSCIEQIIEQMIKPQAD